MLILSEISLGDMNVRYLLDEEKHVGFELYPQKLKDEAMISENKVEQMVQLKVEGDAYPDGFSNGITMRNCESVHRLTYVDQEIKESKSVVNIKTRLEDVRGWQVIHDVYYKKGEEALRIQCEIENIGNEEMILEMFSSFSVGGITPFTDDEATNRMLIYKIRSKWSTEGRLETHSAEELLLEPTWARHGVYSDKFGQVGSLPVRGYFPFVGISDTQKNVVWAASLACPSTWQMEVYRKDEKLCLSGGIGDYDFGHWRKKILPGERFTTIPAYLTTCIGDIDEASQRITGGTQTEGKSKELPVLFNEFCTTWGNPSHQNIGRILKTIKGKDIDYFIIDAGWYADPVKGWGNGMGDWEISEQLFPDGLRKTVELIKDAGFIPGIWFEMETCGKDAKAFQLTDHLLKRYGKVITSGGRRFWDMRDSWTVTYLTEKVIKFLKTYGFEYVKIDYNESIGLGCDGCESLGEGLRQNMVAVRDFYKKMKEELPGLVIEICASGGHRLERSMVELGDFVSFSDAHEEKEIPVIAANMHRLLPPAKSQIWSVLRKEDTYRRIVYSMTNTFLGTMCLSGDVFDLTDQQWEFVRKGIEFYRLVSHIINQGKTLFYGTIQNSYRELRGWQGIARYSADGNEVVCVIHQFHNEADSEIVIPLKEEYMLQDVYEDDKHSISIENQLLKVDMKQDYEAIALHLVRNRDI